MPAEVEKETGGFSESGFRVAGLV